MLRKNLKKKRWLPTLAPFLSVSELADSSVNLAVRPYCDPKDYWSVYFYILEQSKLARDENAVTIPFT